LVPSVHNLNSVSLFSFAFTILNNLAKLNQSVFQEFIPKF
jgi:hypothetical protein